MVLTGGGVPSRRLLQSPRRPNKANRKPSPRGGDLPQTGGKLAAEQHSPRSQPFDVEPAGRFKSLRLLGRGSFGTVTLVKDVRDRKLFALKRIRNTSDSKQKHTRDEIEVMQKLEHHPSIVHLVDVFMNSGKTEVCLLMTYCDSGDLAQMINGKNKDGGRVSEQQALSWAVQLAFALDHLRRHQLVHRDLKPENVMLSDHQAIARIADFGLAVHMSDPDAGLQAEVGTPLYTSPEIFGNERYSYSTDMWSFGVVLYETLALELPFRGDTNQELAAALLEGSPNDLPDCYSFGAHDLVQSMLRRDPAHRPTPQAVLTNPCIRAHVDRFMMHYHPAHVDMRTRRAHIRSLKTQLEAAGAEAERRAGGEGEEESGGGAGATAAEVMTAADSSLVLPTGGLSPRPPRGRPSSRQLMQPRSPSTARVLRGNTAPRDAERVAAAASAGASLAGGVRPSGSFAGDLEATAQAAVASAMAQVRSNAQRSRGCDLRNEVLSSEQVTGMEKVSTKHATETTVRGTLDSVSSNLSNLRWGATDADNGLLRFAVDDARREQRSTLDSVSSFASAPDEIGNRATFDSVSSNLDALRRSGHRDDGGGSGGVEGGAERGEEGGGGGGCDTDSADEFDLLAETLEVHALEAEQGAAELVFGGSVAGVRVESPSQAGAAVRDDHGNEAGGLTSAG